MTPQKCLVFLACLARTLKAAATMNLQTATTDRHPQTPVQSQDATKPGGTKHDLLTGSKGVKKSWQTPDKR